MREQIRIRAAQQQRARRDLVVQLPQKGFTRSGGLLRHGPKRHGDGGVVVQRESSRGQAAHHGARQLQPLGRRVRAKAGGDGPGGVGRLLQGFEPGGKPEVLADALDRQPLDHRAHVVEHQAAHRHGQRQPRLADDAHADQPAHAGAHPVERGDGRLLVQLRQQGQHVGAVLGDLVAHGVGQPVALAAAHHVGADDAGVLAQFTGQHVEIAPLARQAVHADDHVRVGRVAGGIPLPIRHAVLRAGDGPGGSRVLAGGHRCGPGAGAQYVVQRRFYHGCEIR